MSRVGILGGGQLCVMLAESLMRLDATVTVLEPDPDSPARRRLPDVMVAGTDDATALAALCARTDVVTYEFENIAVPPLVPFAAAHRFWPSLHVLETSQDRAVEKAFLQSNGFPVAEHVVVRPGEDVFAAAAGFGFPAILKTARGGYDGKGQYRLRNSDDAAAIQALPQPSHGWVLERVVDIATELSCIVARAADGQTIAFPVLENLHRDHVLDFTVLPARVPTTVADAARETALAIADKLGVVGLLTVEFFVSQDGILRVNELAPRPHNSGHITRQACSISQFDALARVLVGAPLVEPRLLGPGGFCMANLLGDVWLAQGRSSLDLSAWAQHPHVIDVYLYGKREARPKRKMGHLCAWGTDSDAALAAATAFRDALGART